ncbi:helix-turn-helix domain-containing protein [Streptomyces sp. NPDC052052]|uniref:helix-turn-helix domain-containing protein n=1 Tax=Streptomyces sp. NPDC052052 TaxID=3154756 RepID=UPI003417DE68
MRLLRGFTQEELSELSGISVRTIRNLERGQVHKPRRSSVEMLLTVLDPELREKLAARPVERVARITGVHGAEWTEMIGPGRLVWRGPRLSRSPLIGREPDALRLAELVGAQQVVAVTGAAGAGKSRMAQAAAELAGTAFPDGVAVLEMGRIPGENCLSVQEAAQLAEAAVRDLFGEEPAPSGRRALLVLDNTEHLPRTTALLVERMTAECAETHLLVTSRRVPELSGAAVWEVPPLSPEASVELLLTRLRTVCPGLELSGERSRLDELCRQLDRLPRLLEFAAHRLRVVPLGTLLTDSRARRQLGLTDHSLLPHQRSVEASVEWSLGLLEDRHRSLLARLTRSCDDPGTDRVRSAPEELLDVEAMDTLAGLVDSSLVQVERGGAYQYQVLHHVRTVLASPQALAGPRAALSA